MSALRRIASLHRELAQAYEDLDSERARPRRHAKLSQTPLDLSKPTEEAVARVRRGLRRALAEAYQAAMRRDGPAARDALAKCAAELLEGRRAG
ncbi:MAG: hypothetical protein AMXMBFR56_65900 [Polyangiaceae bacterium]